MWVPLVEYGEADKPGADYFVKKDIDALLNKSPEIDTIVLACTHYPHLLEKIRKYTPQNIKIISQGEIVAKATENYLLRHTEMKQRCTASGNRRFLTTEDPEKFSRIAGLFLGQNITAQKVDLEEID